MSLKRWEEASEAYLQVLKVKPDFVWAHHNLGIALVNLEQFEEAYECFEKVREQKPDFWDVAKVKYSAPLQQKLGDYLFKQHRWEEAVVVYERVITLNPEFAWGHLNLGRTLQELDRYHEAIAALEKAVELEPAFAKDLQRLKQAIKTKRNKLSKKTAIEIAETLFDYEFYLKQHTSEQNIQCFTKEEAFRHFLEQDLNSERPLAAPNSWFFPEIYRDIHNSYKPLKLNPFLHYLQNGYVQGLQPLHGVENIPLEVIKKRIEPFFEYEFYLSNSPDLDLEKIDLLEHFSAFGWREGRDPASWFSLSDYQRKFPIVRDLKINPLYFYACLYPGDPRRWSKKKLDQPKFKFSKAIEITPTREINTKPKSVIEFKSLLMQAGYFQPERYSKNLTKAQANRLKIHFVIPEFSKGGGGHMTIFRIVRWLEFFGHECTVWVQNPDFSRHPTGWRDDVYRHFQQVKASFRPLNNHFWYTTGDILVATGWDTVEAVMANEGFNDRFYLVQDYEPYFFARGSNSLRAEDTYRQNIACICASSWLKKLMEEKFGRWARHFNLAYESDIYKIQENDSSDTLLESDEDSISHLVIYSRKHSPRRAVELCLEALDQLALRRNDFVVHFFGDEEVITDISYQAFHHGIIDKHELADLYNHGTVGITFSATNYSLVPQEMMACGLPIVEIENESTVSIFPPDVVSMARPNSQAIADAIEALMNDSQKRIRKMLLWNGFQSFLGRLLCEPLNKLFSIISGKLVGWKSLGKHHPCKSRKSINTVLLW